MGPRQVEQGALFYNFSIDAHVPADHLLRSIDRFVDLSELRRDLAPFYSSLGRPSVDPELMIRMPIIGYCVGIRSERRLCEEVHLNLAYRWFCRLGLDGDVPDHSTFSKKAARWTGARGGWAFFAYSTNYLIEVDNAIRVRHQFSVRFPIGQTCRSAWGRHKAMAASRPRKILGPADSLSNPTSATKSTFSEHKLRCIHQCLGSRREFDNLGGDFFLPQLTFPLEEADELRFDVRLR